jgi:3-oxoacyl-[acyl-carrier-protein] synthase III
MGKSRATITAVGHYVPEKILSNADLEKLVNTNDEWIRTRTGINERRIMEDGACSDMGAKAALAALANRGMRPEEVECIIVATVTPDYFFPSTACLIQQKIGATTAWGFDLSGACSGFLFAMVTAQQFVESGRHRNVLVVGTDKMSAITDYTDRNTCILFGDAAGAVIVEATEEDGYGMLDAIVRCDGEGKDALYMRAGGSAVPASLETVEKRLHYIYQDGKSVFKVAVVKMADVSAEIVERNGLTGAEIDWLVPHQANLRIIDATADRMGLDRSKVMINIDRYGNTTAATIPLCLSEWWLNGKLRHGHRVVMASFGAGYTWGSILLRWSVPNIGEN